MKTLFSAVAVAALIGFTGAASAQVPTGGADAKGNAPLKHAHTVNDGGAKRGATSFTQNEARKHIVNAGYASVSPLEKGKDGVWRGTAMKDGTSRKVGLDFKGNVVEAGPADVPMTGENHGGMQSATSAMSTTTAAPMTASSTPSGPPMHHHHAARRHHHMRHHMHGACAKPGSNGAACSGVDRNMNGVSDKEDRAIKAGAKP